jgi:4-amino-4-deoxy-L-arabinose transferase-like glycosyltransferase
VPAPALRSPAAALDWLRRRPRTTSWAICSSALAVYFVLAPSRIFRSDAHVYMVTSADFGNWLSFTDFRDPVRGYAFPWTLRVFSDVLSPITDNPQVVVRVFMLVVLPLLLCVVVPTLARLVSSSATVTVSRILLLAGLFAFAWYNDLVQPLSDIPALLLMSTGALLILRNHSVLGAAGAGLAFGLAINYRPAYLLAVGTGLVLLFLVEREARSLVLRTVAVCGFIALALAPQVAINLEHYDRFSPTPAGSASLSRLQLTQGLVLYRYDTFVGPVSEHPPDMRYSNQHLTDLLLDDLKPRSFAVPKFRSVPDYVRFVVQHPVDVGAAYARHVFNGLDVRFGGTYVESVDDSNIVWPFVNYVVLTASVVALGLRLARRRSVTWRSPTTWFVAVLVASCVPGVLGAVETRFLLPLYLTLLANLALCTRRAALPASTKARALVGAAVVAGVVAAFALSAATLRTLEPQPMGVDGRVSQSGD